MTHSSRQEGQKQKPKQGGVNKLPSLYCGHGRSEPHEGLSSTGIANEIEDLERGMTCLGDLRVGPLATIANWLYVIRDNEACSHRHVMSKQRYVSNKIQK